MGIYKVGYCPICGAQIMAQDATGRWCSLKPNYRQADLIFADGHRCRTIICKNCLPKVDIKELFEIITAPNSNAAKIGVLEDLKKRGQPTNLIEVSSKR